MLTKISNKASFKLLNPSLRSPIQNYNFRQPSLLTPLNSNFFSTSKTSNQNKPGATKIAFFSAQPYDMRFFDAVNSSKHYNFNLAYNATPLSPSTAILAEGADAVCAFVNDGCDAETLETLSKSGVKAIALRCAGFNNVDLEAAKRLGIEVTRVPEYSPEAVAEHAIALIMTLNRKNHRAFNRVREGNFSLEGLLGITLAGKTAGVIGLGRIGMATARILHGFGCNMLGYDVKPNEEFNTMGKCVSVEELLKQSDIVTLHCPLMPQTHHIINEKALSIMKKGAMLVNTSRGGLVDTKAAIHALKTHQLGALAIDVYEQESGLFFRDLSSDIIGDDVFQRLMTFPNVLVTGHQGFFTKEALQQIAEVTLSNVNCLVKGVPCDNALVHRGGKDAKK